MQRGQQAAWKQNLRVAAASCPLATGGSWWKSPAAEQTLFLCVSGGEHPGETDRHNHALQHSVSR